ncbi:MULTISPECIES: FRG domain-containing protein [Corynebacterium]|uniref:FRG domain-containing protein n=1 Tax=Corynebacterium TaxID=1716 RepID=UPI0008A96A8A|nr:hypothetical protein HMPREF2736_11420 [Corynebacterium sp. HMSC036E10]
MNDRTLTHNQFSPEDFFSPWEGTIKGWDSALDLINKLNQLVGNDRTLAWRGLSKADYSLHSSLYRAVKRRGNANPSEDDLVKNEQRILDAARRHWRFDQMPALELLAHLQHYGAPTRLLDVSMSPLVALWFAVEQKRTTDGTIRADLDGRLFAFDVTDSEIRLEEAWGGYDLPWSKGSQVANKDWQNDLPRFWRPPSYHDRIPAQNSAFLISGVPVVSNGANTRLYRKTPGDGSGAESWIAEEVRKATSINLKLTSTTRKPQLSIPPSFTIRVKASAKEEIRDRLKRIAGLDSAAVYPDIFGLANYGAPWVIVP